MLKQQLKIKDTEALEHYGTVSCHYSIWQGAGKAGKWVEWCREPGPFFMVYLGLIFGPIPQAESIHSFA